ncbi:MAG: hypothetical protein ACRDLV_02665, partial [Solirubrobacteraceae bacterium]
AAALVIASRVIGRRPSPDQILDRLEATATPLPAGGPAPNSDYGYGLLNVGTATARGGPVAPPPASSGSTGTTTQSGTRTQPSSGGILTPR